VDLAQISICELFRRRKRLISQQRWDSDGSSMRPTSGRQAQAGDGAVPAYWPTLDRHGRNPICPSAHVEMLIVKIWLYRGHPDGTPRVCGGDPSTSRSVQASSTIKKPRVWRQAGQVMPAW
jgi:hypothetical protein